MSASDPTALPPGVTPPTPRSLKGFVFKSSLTPGLENAEDVGLQKGTRVTYRLLSGERVTGVIKSAYSKHLNGCYGWEVLFDDTGELGFADERRIVDWDAKGSWKE